MTKVVETSPLLTWIAAKTSNGRLNASGLKTWIAANTKDATITPPVVIVPDPVPIPDPVPVPIPVVTTGWPDATNTGPVAGVVFKRVPEDITSGPGWEYEASFGRIRMTGNGAVLDGIIALLYDGDVIPPTNDAATIKSLTTLVSPAEGTA